MNYATKKYIHATALIVAMSGVVMITKIGPAQAKYDLPSGVTIAQKGNDRQSQIDAYADRIFYERYPEWAGVKIRPHQTNLAQEWLQIRRCEAVVDYIFYQRHPELAGRKIQRHETYLVQEWNDIYDSVEGCQ